MAIFRLSDRIIVPTEKKYGYADAKAKVMSFDVLTLGPALWLDAADAATFALSGSDITQWSDKSGNNRHATSSGLAPPTKDGDAVVFAENDGLNITSPLSATTQSFFIALHTTDTMYVLFRAGDNTYGTVGQSGSGSTPSADFGAPTYRVDGVDAVFTTRDQVYQALNNKISILSIIGATTSSWSALQLAYYGSGYSFAGKFFEFISIEGTPEAADVKALETYLLDKWVA